jgi:YD repeat-containing protein
MKLSLSVNNLAVSEVLSHTVDGETTSYGYDAVGKIAKVDCANLATQLGRPTVCCVIGVHH